jgi:DNA-binding GntR family transcriptional regulator
MGFDGRVATPAPSRGDDPGNVSAVRLSGQIVGAKQKPVNRPPEGSRRYVEVAQHLVGAIVSGQYPVGAVLPNELALCAQFGVSRFTVREALQRLVAEGLVSRRPRVGTVVIARHPHSPYHQTLESIDDLLQYSVGTRLEVIEQGEYTHRTRARFALPIPPGQTWPVARAIRYLSGESRPVCVTRVYLNPGLKDLPARLGRFPEPIYKMIEQFYGLQVGRVEQNVTAAALGRDDAERLQVRKGSPALRIVRAYFATDGSLIEVSESLHPADRFSYATTIRRDAARIDAPERALPAANESGCVEGTT